VGLIADITGNIRFAFFFLVFMMLIPVPLLVFNVDVDRGRTDAQEYSKALLKDVDADLEEERV
jgi:UMF1 family MFS transporter